MRDTARLLLIFALLLVAPVFAQVSVSSDAANASGSPRSIAELKTGAEAGQAEAQYALGRAYEQGQGVRQNDATAVLWYRKAAEQGLAKAQAALGLMYRLGHGVDQDKAEAVHWYEKAAKQRDPSALFNLGVAYYNGDGVGVDDFQAYAYFLLAQEAGSKPADDGVTRLGAKLTSREKDAAYIRIGEMYENGETLPPDYGMAAKWYGKAADDGAQEAQFKMATMFETGRGVPKDPARAAALCDAAAHHKYAPAERCLGFYYQRIGRSPRFATGSKTVPERR